MLLVILCAAVIYAWIAIPKQRSVDPGQGAQRQTKRPQQNAATAVFPTIADLDFSGGGDNPYQPPLKNLFGPLYLRPKVAKKPRPAPRRIAKVIKRVERPETVVPVVIPPRGPAPIPPLNVLGFLNKAGDYTVFLSSRQGEIYLVKPGVAFAEDLVVRSISAREIAIGHRQTGQQIVLPLGEVKTQRLPTVKLQSDRPNFETPQESGADKPKPVPSPEQQLAPDKPKPVPSPEQQPAPGYFLNKRIKGLNNDALQ
ncbi:MAG: hypothetical protein QNK27_12340 [Desulfuromusa sp.]|nr:hypothetical protein [Desulfuromusa sp.]